MTEHNDPSPGASSDAAWSKAAIVSVVALCAFQVWWGMRTRAEIRELREIATRIETSASKRAGPAEGGADGTLIDEFRNMRSDFDILASDVDRLHRKMDSLTKSLENRGEMPSGPAQPPELDWTQPDLFEAARNAADSVGIQVTKDEVRVPGRIILREGPLEYFAVLRGGKEHESMFSLLGNIAPDARRPKDFGAKLNTALQAIGFKRGKSIRFSPNGTLPASGQTVRIYVEWKTAGRTEIVRAEDIVWNRLEERPMTRGAWVYVGSSFVPGEEDGTFDFAADLTAEAIATYSAPNTIIDNVEKGAQDDTVFLVASPRIPDDVGPVTIIFRQDELSGVKEFPAPPSKEK